MYFIAINSLNGWKARNRRLYPTKSDAITEMASLASIAARGESNVEFRVFDADHEPGRAILKARHGFA